MTHVRTIMAAGAFALVATLLFITYQLVITSPYNQAAATFHSVEVGVAELSPNGEAGGYAIPASGDSNVLQGCTLTLSDTSVSSGDLSPDGTWGTAGVILRSSWSPNESYNFYGNFRITLNGTTIYNDTVGYNNNRRVIPYANLDIPGTNNFVGRLQGTLTLGTGEEQYDLSVDETCSVTLEVLSAVDLEAESLSLLSGNLVIGDSVRFRAQTTNNGPDAVSETFANRFYWKYLSDTGWNQLNTINRSSLGVGVNITHDSNAINVTKAGTIRVLYRTDQGNGVAESNEDNNEIIRDFAVASQVDLRPDFLQAVGNLRMGSAITLSAQHENVGSDSITSPYTSRFSYLYNGTGAWVTQPSSDPTNGRHTQLGSGFRDSAESTAFTLDREGLLYINYCVDVNDEIAELNEGLNKTYNNTGDNCITDSVTVEAGQVDLEAQRPVLAPGGTLQTNTPMAFNGPHINNGPDNIIGDYQNRFYYSNSATGPWTEFSRHWDEDINAGQTKTNTSATISFSTAGTKYIRYCVDQATPPSATVTETDETEASNCEVDAKNIVLCPTCTPPPELTCSVSNTAVDTNVNVTYTADFSGGTAPYEIEWRGSHGHSVIKNNEPGPDDTETRSFTTAGNKWMQVWMTPEDGAGTRIGPANCPDVTVTDTSGNTDPQPTVNLTADGVANTLNNVPPGNTVNLEWTTTNAGSCTASGAPDFTGAIATANSSPENQNVVVNSSNTYTVECTNPQGTRSASDSVDVNVTTAPSGGPTVGPTIIARESDSGESTTLIRSGDAVDIEWTVGSATGACTLSGPSMPSTTSADDSEPGITLQSTATFRISCDSGDAQVKVNVLPFIQET